MACEGREPARLSWLQKLSVASLAVGQERYCHGRGSAMRSDRRRIGRSLKRPRSPTWSALEEARLAALESAVAARCGGGFVDLAELVTALTLRAGARVPLWTRRGLEADLSALVDRDSVALGVAGADVFVLPWPPIGAAHEDAEAPPRGARLETDAWPAERGTWNEPGG